MLIGAIIIAAILVVVLILGMFAAHDGGEPK